MAVIGGAKIADKIEVLNRFVDIADMVIVGGAMANTFLLAQDIDVAKVWLSLMRWQPPASYGEGETKSRQSAVCFICTQDAVVAKSIDKSAKPALSTGRYVFSEVESYPKPPTAAI